LEQYEKHGLQVESGIDVQNAGLNDEDTSRSREADNEQVCQLSVEDSEIKATRGTSWKEAGIGASRDKLPSTIDADDVCFLSHPSKHPCAHSPHQCSFHPWQAADGVSGLITPSLTPSTIVYDYSRHTTHHGSHNYQGQYVNQRPSAHGPALAGVPPQNIYMKHFNGNEIHCEHLLNSS